ncbi:hypothetical protein ACFQYP_34320 [Nonomuraea antimicrobica]
MTIDLGFAWATLRSGERIAFVDEGWQAQSAEHLYRSNIELRGLSCG